jgi:hypothetical protein
MIIYSMSEVFFLIEYFSKREQVSHLQKFALTSRAVLVQGVRRLRRPGGRSAEARHIERLLLYARERCSKTQLLQRLHANPDLACGLADGIGETADSGDSGERATERADAGARQLPLAAKRLSVHWTHDRPRSQRASGSARRPGRPKRARS